MHISRCQRREEETAKEMKNKPSVHKDENQENVLIWKSEEESVSRRKDDEPMSQSDYSSNKIRDDDQ